MQVVSNLVDLRSALAEVKAQGKTVAFVPTMGNLHHGHLSLIKKAREHADFVVASIFVNPTQFGENEDIDNYPKTLEADKKHLIEDGCNLLYLPNATIMYPEPDLTRVQVNRITKLHCGASRPGHFTGVATIVLKLFNQVQPDVAIFGLKDFQQFRVIEMMVENLFLPIKIVGVNTGRAEDGLAHSSRNNYLTANEREIAPTLYATLQKAAEDIRAGKDSFDQIIRHAKEALHNAGMTPDYFNISRQIDLEPAEENDKHLVILAAAFLGKARLIDNITVEL
ncbi:pantoate--beta-alanine ligase [Reinekea marinisedimentorum]|uniref:Pantothenate synthetase n=1 Tax=Reinekea marinisedimentorum TaxID=230495 RepID=A0A4R3I7A6_9GAMM|nr:pantoate--beta-alanine ligase [Reinekea marinisedimentorum]TCS41640.1 pantoate--beta-alanine ligase [Reinekea marinisedimentorum]